MYDVGVLGVGSMGSMALWQLAKRGVSVIGFEQFSVGHDRGAAGGESRIFRTAYRESPEYVPLLQEARRQWRNLESEAGADLLSMHGVATIGDRDHHHVKSVISCIKDYGLEADILDAGEANSRYPSINVLPNEMAVIDKAGGLVKPERAVTSAVGVAEAKGATVMRRAKVYAIEPDETGVWVRTEYRDVRVGKLILTAGAWAGDFLNSTRQGLITPHRLVLSWFLPKNPSDFSPEKFPVVNRLSHGADFSVFSSMDGNTVKAGLNIDVGPVTHPNEISRTVDFSEVSRTCAIVSELYPGLWPEPIRSSSYTDGFTVDEHALVGPLDDFPNIIAGVGFSAHGFKMAPAIGAALADIATHGSTKIDIRHLSPGRSAVN